MPAVLGTRLKLLTTLKTDYQLDAISISLIAFNVILSAYLTTVAVNLQATDIAFKSVLMLLLTLTGLIMFIVVFQKFPSIDHTLTPVEAAEIASASIVGFIFVLLLQTTVIQTYPIVFGSITDAPTLKLLLTNIAIGEEVFFTFFLQSAITKQLTYTSPTYATIGGILGKSLIFSIYHYVYYGMPQLVLSVFVSSLVLGAAYSITKRPSVPMLIHILVNLT